MNDAEMAQERLEQLIDLEQRNARLSLAMRDLGSTLELVNKAAMQTEERLVKLEQNILHVLKSSAVAIRPCKDCGVLLYFVPSKSGSLQPFEETGLPHFSRCPAAEKFRRPR